jgi:hypothetical protein
MAIIKQAFFKIEYILYLYNTYPMKGTQIYIPCNTETFGVSQFPVTIPRPQKQLRRYRKENYNIPITIAEEVDASIKEWYAAKGLPVPPDEIGIGATMAIIDEKEETRILLAREKAEEIAPTVAPPFGTPEFWAYHRAKKAAENKRRAEEGLPSIDEEKAAKIKEREAKKAAKAAKMSSK